MPAAWISLSAAQSVVAVLARHLRHQAHGRGWLGTAADRIDPGRPRGRRDLLPPRATARRSADRRAAVRDAGVQRRAGDEHARPVHGARLVPVHHPVPAARARHGAARGRLWMAPSGIVFALGSMAAPILVRNFHPASVIATGLLLSALGFASLTQIVAARVPVVHVRRACLPSVSGWRPIGAITTDLVMTLGAARAGRRRLGHLGDELRVRRRARHRRAREPVHVVYGRGMRAAAELGTLPTSAVESARDGLGAAIEAAHTLPASRARSSCRRRARRSSTPSR